MKHLITFAKQSYAIWSEHRAARWAAAVAYYAVFSLAPLLLIATGIAGIFFGEASARQEVIDQVSQLMGPQAAEMLSGQMSEMGQGGKGILMTLLGLGILLWGAGNVFVCLREGLETVWGLRKNPEVGIRGFLQDRFSSFAIVLSVGFLLMISLLLSAALVGFRRLLNEFWPIPLWILPVFDLTLSLLVITALFMLLLKYLPSVDLHWRDTLLGASFTAVLFVVGKTLIGLYLGNTGVASAYGAAGSLVLILLWIHYSTQILFMGAAVTRVHVERKGSRILPGRFAVAAEGQSGGSGAGSLGMGSRSVSRPSKQEPALELPRKGPLRLDPADTSADSSEQVAEDWRPAETPPKRSVASITKNEARTGGNSRFP